MLSVKELVFLLIAGATAGFFLGLIFAKYFIYE